MPQCCRSRRRRIRGSQPCGPAQGHRHPPILEGARRVHPSNFKKRRAPTLSERVGAAIRGVSPSPERLWPGPGSGNHPRYFLTPPCPCSCARTPKLDRAFPRGVSDHHEPRASESTGNTFPAAVVRAARSKVRDPETIAHAKYHARALPFKRPAWRPYQQFSKLRQEASGVSYQVLLMSET